MKPKRRVWYAVQPPGFVWWDSKVGWNESHGSCTRFFRTARRAFSHGETLPVGTVTHKFSIRKGKRYCQDFEKV